MISFPVTFLSPFLFQLMFSLLQLMFLLFLVINNRIQKLVTIFKTILTLVTICALLNCMYEGPVLVKKEPLQVG